VKLVRSWPDRIPGGRAHVVDDIPRIVLDRYDYKPLAGVGDDVLLLEWDMAVGQADLQAFAERAQQSPDRVLVAPYVIYADSYGLPADVWAHRWWAGDGAGTISPAGAVPVQTGDPVCQLFGLGMCYLPATLIRRFAALSWSSHYGDTEFSMWHYERVTHDVPIMWDVRPVHLHYQTPSFEESGNG
jgi:hypothetical protein